MSEISDYLKLKAMSALGHKRTFAAQKVMSALPPIGDILLGHRAHSTALDHRALSCGNAFAQIFKGFSQQILHFWFEIVDVLIDGTSALLQWLEDC